MHSSIFPSNIRPVQGFTLIELLIVIAIIGILASILVPGLLASQQRSYDTGAQTCAKSLQTVEGISQIDNRMYMLIGTGVDKIGSTTDGVNAACKMTTMYITDRSSASTIVSDYAIDIWDTRGNKVFTITPSYLKANVAGATPFSNTGTGGSNLP
ncbi:type II secretion system protein (plasmid) [Deinococcus radiomollis]|uniref:type II secretion system protein n=1 Tax=Deinococcus radiomollis TaxID=468916 RepID=UPI003891CCCF